LPQFSQFRQKLVLKNVDRNKNIRERTICNFPTNFFGGRWITQAQYYLKFRQNFGKISCTGIANFTKHATLAIIYFRYSIPLNSKDTNYYTEVLLNLQWHFRDLYLVSSVWNFISTIFPLLSLLNFLFIVFPRYFTSLLHKQGSYVKNNKTM